MFYSFLSGVRWKFVITSVLFFVIRGETELFFVLTSTVVDVYNSAEI